MVICAGLGGRRRVHKAPERGTPALEAEMGGA